MAHREALPHFHLERVYCDDVLAVLPLNSKAGFTFAEISLPDGRVGDLQVRAQVSADLRTVGASGKGAGSLYDVELVHELLVFECPTNSVNQRRRVRPGRAPMNHAGGRSKVIERDPWIIEDVVNELYICMRMRGE